MTVDIPKVITHENAGPLREALLKFEHFQPGPHKCGKECHQAWWAQEVTLELPTGELAVSGLQTLALTGSFHPTLAVAPIVPQDRFNAQGLEGKVRIRKPLLNALLNLDIIAPQRAQIITR